MVASESDDLAFERIVNVPKRGIGQATMQQLHSTAREMDVSLVRASQHLLTSGIIKGKLGASMNELFAGFSRWRDALSVKTIPDVLEQILDESGYRRMWKEDKSPEAAGRLENLRELSRAIGEFESLGAFLEHVSLVSDKQNEDSSDMVSLMTLHAAKGLEFDAVFLPGWEEGLFPHQRAVDESGAKGLEEERRLAYVGITRARKWLTIIHAGSRRIYNQWQASVPSRFLKELPEEHVERMNGNARSQGIDWQSEVAAIMGAGRASTSDRIGKGTRVFHQKFGYGIVQSAQGDHLEIAFDKAGHKKVMAGFVEKAS